VYIASQLIYSFAMLFLAVNKSIWGAVVISPAAGIMYSTLFTMPYIFIASYHANESVRFATTINQTFISELFF
jgi:solute carrier family 45 protein 1/2/4